MIKLPNPTQISVQGVHLDRITSTSPFVFERVGQFRPEDAGTTIRNFLRPFAEADKMVSSLPERYHLTQQPREKAFWRTLIGNTVDERDQESKKYLALKGIPPYSGGCPVYPAGEEYGSHYRMFRELQGFLSRVDEWRANPPTHPDQKKAARLLGRDVMERVNALESDGWFLAATGISLGRKFAITEAGNMTLVPPLAREGDDLYVLYGVAVPFAVRKHGGDLAVFDLVGPCYVHGFMDGEGILQGGHERDHVFE